MRRDSLPSNARRRPSQTMHFGAQSRGLRAPCERFAPWVTPGPRITRFRLAADLGRMGLDTHRVSNKVSKITSRHLVLLDRAFPAHALVHESGVRFRGGRPGRQCRVHTHGRPREVARGRLTHHTSGTEQLRSNGQWQAFCGGTDGKRRQAKDLARHPHTLPPGAQVDCEHHSPACRGHSVTLAGAGEWWPDPQVD